ncbi:outer membrane protein [Qipengyuania sp.]|uniref:outer membrane protein n=1 Tax=Qipengyuania sp. TaxID=2004515 RepID=UPI0037355F01
MKKTALLIAAGAIAAVGTPAMAQDAVNEAFTGPRAEVLLGYDISKAGSTADNDANENDDQSIDGFNYGVGLGFDFAAGGVVLGVEGEYTGSTAKTEFNDGDFEGIGIGNVETGRDLYIGARAGVLANPDLLIYVKGGYTNASYNLRTRGGTTNLDRDFRTDGYRVGAGAEYAMTENTFAKLEYRYSNYSDAEIDFDNGDEVSVPDVDIDRHQIMAGFGLRF